MHFISVAVFTAALAAVSVSATSCSSSQFLWTKAKSECCLPHGGPPSTPATPPKGSSCPGSWYWHQNQGCCVPDHPNPPATPTCDKGSWDHGSQCCHEPQPTSSQPAPQPTKGWGNHNKRTNNKKRAALGGRGTLSCAAGSEACRVGGVKTATFECVDPKTDVNACGGCVSSGQGQDCTAIPNSWNVGCAVGICQVYTCEPGFKVALDGRTCISI